LNKRGETHALRATPAFKGRAVFNDVAVRSGAAVPWYGKILMFFRIRLKRRRVVDGQEEEMIRNGPCALVRWYRSVERLGDSSLCPMYTWEDRKGQPQVSVISVSSIIGVAQMIPIAVFTRTYYQNEWLRRENF
jgi:hypothetical protein